MPSSRPYTITASASSLSLKRSVPSEVSVTITNHSERSIRTEARIKSLDNASADWLSVKGANTIEIPGGQSEQFTVAVKPRASATSGEYRFRVDAIGVNRPEEDFAEGPVVTLNLAEPAVVTPPTKFPWWIVAAGVGAVALVAIVFFMVRGGGDADKELQKLVGQPVPEALKTLENRNFEVVTEPIPILSREDTGPVKSVVRVATAEEAAKSNMEASAERKPRVKVSFEVPGVEVPPSEGKTSIDMVKAIASSGLRVGEVVGQDSNPPKPIHAIAPQSGTVVAKGSDVKVYITKSGRAIPWANFKMKTEAVKMLDFKVAPFDASKLVVPPAGEGKNK